MLNLKSPEKKYYFKVIFSIVMYVALTTAIAVILVWSNLEKLRLTEFFETEKKAITEKYETRIKQLDKEKTYLLNREAFYKYKIDSLYKIKNQVIIEYDEKIEGIYNADAYDHANWLDSIIRHHIQVNSLGTQ